MSTFLNIPQLLVRRLKGSPYWRDIAWLASGTAVAQLITLTMMPVFSRLFSPGEFAVQALFVQLASFLAVVATLRYEYFVQLPEADPDAWRLVRVIGGMCAAVTVLLTPICWVFRDLIARMAGDVALAPWLALIPITAASASMALGLQGYAQRIGKYRRAGTAEVAAKIASAGSVLAGFFVLPGPAGLVLAGFGAAAGKITWLLHDLRRPKGDASSSYWQLIRRYFSMSGSMVISHGLLAVTTMIPVMFIGHAYGSDTLGQFAMASLAVTLPSALVGGAIGNVYYQRAGACWAMDKNFADLWRTTATKLLLVGLPSYAVAVVALPWAVPVILGEPWVQAGQFGRILAISAFFSFVTSPMNKACLVVGAWWYVLLHHVVRVLTTAIVAGMALVLHWSVELFVGALVIQSTGIYLMDYWVQWRFAHRMPPSITVSAA